MIPGQAFMVVLAEAKRVFGEPSTWDSRAVTDWMMRRAKELARGDKPPADVVPFEPRGFDAKQRQCGSDD